MTYPNTAQLETRLNYRFSDSTLLERALNHRTFVNEQKDPELRDNQRLEFLGDAVLGLVIGHILMEHHPDIKEGELTRMRAGLVNETQLAQMARQIDLGPHMRLGKGEMQSGGMEKKSILADAFEALMAAVFLDGGYGAAFACIQRLFMPLFFGADRDWKSQLQEQVQKRNQSVPAYTVIAENGPDHDKTFHVTVNVSGISATGTGKSKKQAEQDAAGRALAILYKEEQDA